MIKAVIFDWGRTLYDSDAGVIFPGVPVLLAGLARRHQLAIVSLVTGDFAARVAARRAVLREADLEPFFAVVSFVPAEKERAYEGVLTALGAAAQEVVVVDD